MALPRSTDAPVFMQVQPDWNKDIVTTQVWKTDVLGNHEGGEQRASRRNRARQNIRYEVSALSVVEYTVRKSAGLQELGAAVVCPMWPDWISLSSMSSVDVADLAVSLALKKFKAGSYAYFEQSGKVSTFRKIVTVNSTTLTLHATDAFPVPPIPAFTAGAKVYPCILGERQTVGDSLQKVNTTDCMIVVLEL